MVLNFAFFMDVTILALLAATVFFAFRLSMSLRRFRESRKDMEKLIVRLATNIDHAERAINGMQNSAQTSGAQLQEIINSSKNLSDELHFMNDAGNRLAERLEKLAEKNSALVNDIQNASGGVKNTPISFLQHEPFEKKAEPEKQDDVAGFMIQDREFEDDNYEDLDDLDFGDEQPASGFQSQAERELYEALYKKGRKSGVGRA